MGERSTEELIAEVAKAHTDLNVFAAVQAIMEGGCVSAAGQEYARRIITAAKVAQQRALLRYDSTLDKIEDAARRARTARAGNG